MATAPHDASGPHGSHPTREVVLPVIGSVCGALLATAVGTSPTARLVGAAIGAAVPPIVSVVGPWHGLRAGMGVVVTVAVLVVTYGGLTARDYATDSEQTFPLPPDVTKPDAGSSGSALVGPGETEALRFEGREGQRVSVHASGAALVALRAAGEEDELLEGEVGQGGGTTGDSSVELPVDGPYEVTGKPAGNERVTLKVLTDAEAEARPDDAAAELRVDEPGQNGVVRFEGRRGQRVSLYASPVTFAGEVSVALVNRANRFDPLVQGDVTRSSPEVGNGSIALPYDGPYLVTVRPDGDATGTLALRVLSDAEARLRANEPAAGLRIDEPGQNGIVRFEGRRGQRVSLYAARARFGTNGDDAASVTLVNPSNSFDPIAQGDVDAGQREVGNGSVVLPENRPYLVTIRPDGGATGSVSLRVTSDATARARIDGPPVALRIGTPGQNGIVRFRGRQGQRVNLRAAQVRFGDDSVNVTLVNPHNSFDPLAQSDLGPDSSAVDDESVELPATRTYEVTIRPDGPATGSLALRVLAE